MIMSKKIVMVTGASTGIGAVYADRLAKLDHDLVLVARDRARLESLAGKLQSAFPIQAEVLQADLTVASDLAKVAARLREDNRITALVNSAGIAMGGSFTAADPKRLDEMVRLNVMAIVHLTQAAAAAFTKAGRGAIVNIGSVAGLMPELGASPVYGACKAFMLHFTRALSRELQGTGVKLQVVLSGPIRTEMWERSGISISDVPPDSVMEPEALVDAALAGIKQGEVVTIPCLPDPADWEALEKARLNLLPNLSKQHPADRYRI
jgi:short-subunit dehydrogenase